MQCTKSRLAALMLAGAVVTIPATADAYHIDCAILLCLAGGFPSHPICAAAKAVMIQRITPWPIVPPVQPWNCAMGVSGPMQAPELPKVYKASWDHASQPWGESESATIWKAVDFSHPEYDFIRTMKVWHIRYNQWSNKDDCVVVSKNQVGSYDLDLNFTWQNASITAVPDYVIPKVILNCPTYHLRGIGVEFRDYAGVQYGEYYPY